MITKIEPKDMAKYRSLHYKIAAAERMMKLLTDELAKIIEKQDEAWTELKVKYNAIPDRLYEVFPLKNEMVLLPEDDKK